jgi:hypothetical protein
MIPHLVLRHGFEGHIRQGARERHERSVNKFGRQGAPAQSFLKPLGDVAAACVTISRTRFVRRAYQDVGCALQARLGLLYRKSLFNIARASERQFMPGHDVPVQEAGLIAITFIFCILFCCNMMADTASFTGRIEVNSAKVSEEYYILCEL